MKLKENKRESFVTVRFDEYEEDFQDPVKFVIFCCISHEKLTAKIDKLKKRDFFFHA